MPLHRLLLLCLLLLAAPARADPTPAQYRADALSIAPLIGRVYAYPERLPGGAFHLTAPLQAEAEAVNDHRSLLRFAERALFLLADPHAITGSALGDSWAIVPSDADLWIVRAQGHYIVEAVRPGSPAAAAGVRPGDRLTSVGGAETGRAVTAFWHDLGVDEVDDMRAGFAARILAAGRRDRPRQLGVSRAGVARPAIALASLYAQQQADRPPLTVSETPQALHIRFNDSLGEDATIAAFDAAMARARPGARVIVDLSDTPSGGNTSVARAVLGWFVTRPHGYQMHNLPSEERETGIARQWIELVLPRPGKFHRGPVTVEVGRWTGSMGEGLAIGFDAIGGHVTGTRMAGLLGAVEDYPLGQTGLVLKLPSERLMHVNGTPREAFVPHPR